MVPRRAEDEEKASGAAPCMMSSPPSWISAAPSPWAGSHRVCPRCVPPPPPPPLVLVLLPLLLPRPRPRPLPPPGDAGDLF